MHGADFPQAEIMKEKLNIALCQNDIVWEDAEATISGIDGSVRSYLERNGTDILVLPETYSVGFTMNPSASERPDGPSAQWLRKISADFGIAVIASVPTLDRNGRGEECRYNRCYFICPDGTEYHYDKHHLFNPSGEGDAYTPGKERVCVDYCGWNIELNVCYDLRFPVWSRNTGNRYDLLVNIANWPVSRIKAAATLIKARAVENCAYALFCNRTGSDPLCEYDGRSTVVNYFGDRICDGRTVGGQRFYRASLDASELKRYREKFAAWKDADEFILR